MDCETASPLIEALCDDELDVASAARVVAHLEGCEACSALRREAETRKSVLLEARPLDRLPDGVRVRLVREVGRAAPPRRRAAGAVPALLVAAALLAGGFAAYHARRSAAPRTPALSDLPVVEEVTGEVFCLRCALARLFPGTSLLDERHLPVLRTDRGELITLLDGAVTAGALSRKGCAGRRVAVTIRLYPRQELAEVLAVRTLGPSDGVPAADVLAAAARAGSTTR
jgi:hypothetical protein